jgi:hypothetical protein
MKLDEICRQKLALQGGPKAVTADPGDVFRWPIVTAEDGKRCWRCCVAAA